MEISGEAVLPAGPVAVRAALRDRGVLSRLVPASRQLRAVGGGWWEGDVTLGVPPLTVRYPVRVGAEEDAAGMRLTAAGTGPAEGLLLEARCTVGDGDQPGTTTLRYRIRWDLRTLPRWLSGAAGPRLAADFLDGLRREVGGG